MVQDEETGLLFPTGDVPLLVSRINSIFESEELAIKLGENAMKTARKRHDPDQIVRDQLAAYETVHMDANGE